MDHIIFICTANICRSPMAEGIFRHLAELSGRTNFIVSSMGIHGERGLPATDSAIKVSKENGIDISSHRSSPLIEKDLMNARFLLCMEPAQATHIKTFFPAYSPKTHLLGVLFANKLQKTRVIRDPMGASASTYRHIYRFMEKHIKRILPLIS